jgi:hypothetical protein
MNATLSNLTPVLNLTSNNTIAQDVIGNTSFVNSTANYFNETILAGQEFRAELFQGVFTLDIINATALMILSFLIFYMLKQIYEFSFHESVNYLKKSFFFGFLFNLNAIVAFAILFLFEVSIQSLIIIFGLFAISLIPYFLSQYYLLRAILVRIQNQIVSSKLGNIIFTIGIIIVVIMDQAISQMIYELGIWFFLSYKIISFLVILLIIEYNHASINRNKSFSPFSFAVILLFIGNFLGNIFDIVGFELYQSPFDLLIEIIIYIIVFTGIHKWYRRLLK